MIFFILCLLKDNLRNPALRLSWNHSMGTPQSMVKGKLISLNERTEMISGTFFRCSPFLPVSVLLEWILSHLVFIQASNSVRHKQWENMIQSRWREWCKNTKPWKKRWWDMTILFCSKHYMAKIQHEKIKSEVIYEENICSRYSNILMALYKEHLQIITMKKISISTGEKKEQAKNMSRTPTKEDI